MKAAIYARAATNEGDVLDNQVAACRAYCKERGYTVVDELVIQEMATSTNKQREGIKKLIQAAKEGKFDILVIKDKTRLSRRESQRIAFTYLFDRETIYIEYIEKEAHTMDSFMRPILFIVGEVIEVIKLYS